MVGIRENCLAYFNFRKWWHFLGRRTKHIRTSRHLSSRLSSFKIVGKVPLVLRERMKE